MICKSVNMQQTKIEGDVILKIAIAENKGLLYL